MCIPNGTDPLPRYPSMIFMIDKNVDLSLATIHERVQHPRGFEPVDVYLKRLDGGINECREIEFIHPAGAPVRGEIRLNPPSEDSPQPLKSAQNFKLLPLVLH